MKETTALWQLKQYNNWVCWKYEQKPGEEKPTKIPKNPHTGGNAQSNNPQTWGSFALAQAACQKYGFDGLAFMLDPAVVKLVGIDLDDCINNGVVDPWALKIVKQLNSYTEISPSGKGLRIFIIGELPPNGRKKGDIEIYDSVRFLTVTGNHLPETPDTILDRSNEINQLHQELWPAKQPEQQKPVTPNNLDDLALIEKIRNSNNGKKFDDLWIGNTTGYPSHSEADFALCEMLNFYSQGDKDQIDRLFRQSGLMRKKWDRVTYADGRTHGQAIIDEVMKFKHRDPSYYHNNNGHNSNGSYSTTPVSKQNTWLAAKRILYLLERGELGDAELLAELYHNKIVFDHAEKEWYLWDGNHWKADRRRQVGGLLNDVAAQYLHAAAELQKTLKDEDEDNTKKIKDKIKELQKRAGSLCFRNRINNVLDLASKQPNIALTGDEWEHNPWLLAVENGVVDLKTGDFRQGKPEDLIKTVSPISWEGLQKEAVRWELFLSEIFAGDTDLINFVQRLLGYSITGLSTEHILPILWGKGRNGKETLLEIIKYILGDLASPVSKDVLMESRNNDPGRATPHLYALRSLRLAWVSETKAGAQLNVEQTKWLTGGGTLTARPLHGNQITFSPAFTLLMITNHKPKVDPDDYAAWQRLLLIPFTLSFVSEPKKENEKKADKDLLNKLKKETSGILAWLVRGCLEWQKNGLNPPETVKSATQQYQQEEDTVYQFIEDCCQADENTDTRASYLYKAYKAWCYDNNVKEPESNKTFGEKIASKFARDRDSAGNIYRKLKCNIQVFPV